MSRKLTLDAPVAYQVVVPGEVAGELLDWNGGLQVRIDSDADGNLYSILSITADQAGLHGFLTKLYSLGLPLISVRWAEYSGRISEESG